MAQAPPGVYADAHNPSGTPDPDKLDVIWSVNNITGALSVKVPFPSGPTSARGPRIPFALLYNSSATVSLQEANTYSSAMDLGFTVLNSSIVNYKWMPGSYNAATAPVGPWSTTGPFLTDTVTTIPNYTPVYNVNGSQIDGPTVAGCQISGPYLYSDETGSTHEMNVAYVNGYEGGSSASQCTQYYGSPTNATTWDGSDLQTAISVTGANIGVATQGGYGPSILYPNGTQYWGSAGFWSSGTLEDANGNVASIAQDSAGRTTFATNFPIAQVGEIAAKTYTVTTEDASGNNENYSVTVSQVPVGVWTMPHPQQDPNDPSTWEICCFNPGGAGNVTASVQPMTSSSVDAVTAITLPNGTAYGFIYDPLYGTIQRINFPTGGYVRFVWGVRGDCGGYGDFSRISCLVVTDAYISSGSGEDHWSYNFPTTSSSGYITSLTSTVTAPDGSYTSYTGTATQYSSTLFPWGAPSWQETSKLIYTSAGKLLESVATTYAGAYPGQITTTLYDGATPLQKQTQLKYDGYDNVIEKDESDYYSCSGNPCAAAANPPAWLRKTFTNYLWSSPNPTQPSYPYSQAHIVDKPSQVTVTDGSGNPVSMVQYNYDEFPLSGSAGILNHDDANYPATMVGPRGNLTSEKHCLAFSGSNCANWNPPTTYRYDLAGMVVSETDPKSYTTTYSYADAYQGFTPRQPTDAYLTLATYANNATDHYSYYYTTGQLASHTDWNSQITSYSYGDSLNRLTEIDYPPGGGSMMVNYNGDPTPPKVTVTTTTGEAAGPIVRTTLYDGLGRVVQTQLNSDSGVDYVDTTYNTMGQVYSTSNPYRTLRDPTYGLTLFPLYDALGRKQTQTQPDSSSLIWTYAGNATTYTDEASHSWARTSDGLGRLTQVMELGTPANPLNLETDYRYDALDNLTSVNQIGNSSVGETPRARSFTYDPLSRLIVASNPETGTIQYSYDANGNLVQKLSQPINLATAPTILGYCYDVLNRVTYKFYSVPNCSSPSSGVLVASYTYDSSSLSGTSNTIGRLTEEDAISNGVVYSKRIPYAYDAMGRVTSELQCVFTKCTTDYPGYSTYKYDLAGKLTDYSNGLGTTLFSTQYDGAGHVLSVKSSWNDATHPPMLFSNPSYSPAGGLTGALYGTGLTVIRFYDSRLRVNGETDTGSIVQSYGTSGTTSITITGSEQSK
ncbi:hypothetical protein GCM10011507_34460 [Edaphobacter acidisoli]|uniref:RHS repeat protein n=2 Tax=Edaphobacter acidisoli TaxID=2040573 RepID=A0A916WAC8_9BACT|nr:hypothetical protein GCM10011507_34460 [Edaphobacter acidisoli]